MPRAPALFAAIFVVSCGQPPLPAEFTPLANLPPPSTKVSPPPGPFNGEVELTFTTELPATIYVSVDGSDPKTTTKGRMQGDSKLVVKLTATTEVKYFASANGRDEELHTEKWVRAGGPVGTISGVVVVGDFSVGKQVWVTRNAEVVKLTKPTMPSEIPFSFKGLMEGPHRLTATLDRDGDGNPIPFLDLQSPTETVTLDFKDPYKASAENVKLYLASSPPELCTIAGTITMPVPAFGQNLQIAAVGTSGFGAGFDPQALLTQLQNGYQVLTNPTDTEYPYVITNLQPGLYVPVPLLLGFGGGGIAMNFLANPLKPVNCKAGETAISDHAFGPITLAGTANISAASSPTGNFTYGVVAAKNISLVTGIQGVLMPVFFARDQTTMGLTSGFGATSLRDNSSFSLRVFSSGGATAMANPITDALTWVVNPFAPQPPHATVMLGSGDQTVTVNVP
jgi:hypothetical protein